MTALLALLSLLASALAPIDVPVPPGSDARVLALFAPFTPGQPIDGGPFRFDDVHIAARTVEATVTDADERLLATIHLDLPARGVRIVPAPGASADALAAAQRVAEVARTHLAQVELVIREPTPAPSRPGTGRPGSHAATFARPPPPLLLALLVLALALAFARRRLGLPPAPRATWLAVAALTATLAVALALLDDVVGHPNAHGWDTVRALVGPSGSPYRAFQPYGLFDVHLAAVLGAPAAAGHETFLASRVAATLCVPLTFLFALAATARPRVALAAAALYATHPALLYSGRAESVTTPGVALLLVTALVATLAARRRDPRLLAAAALSLGVLANFRLMGLVLAPLVALLLLLPAADPPQPAAPPAAPPRRWWPRVLAAWAVGAAIAVPHGLAILALFGQGTEPRTLHPELNVLTSPLWTAPALLALAATGALWLLRRRPLLAAIALAWTLAAVIAPSAATSSWQDQARYHGFGLPAFALLAGAAFDLPLARLPRRAAAALVALVAAWLVHGAVLPWRAQANGNIDTAQLHLWREAAAALPRDAVLVVPVRLGNKNRASLPDTELLAARPDVRVLDLRALERPAAGAPPRPTFWFRSVACHLEDLDPAAAPDSDCRAAEATLRLSPVLVRPLSDALDPAITAQLDGGYGWSFYRLPDAPLPVGLYRVDGWR